jgi:prepilin-type N-terminal cleavage/methylation domain-containing protein
MMAHLYTARPVGFVGGLKTPDPAIVAQRERLRRAMTLVEVLVVVVLSSLVMGVVISFTVALQQSDRDMRSFAVRIDRLNELAAVLRTDLRQAEETSLRSTKQLAINLGSGREIQYELADRGCLRVVPAEGDSPPAREFFAVGSAEKWQLERDVGGRLPLAMVTLHFAEKDKESESRPAPLVVYAALAADLPTVVVPTPKSSGNESEQELDDVEQEVAEEAEGDDIN